MHYSAVFSLILGLTTFFASPLYAQSSNVDVSYIQLRNYLGEGHDPNLSLKLSANDAGWSSFSIDYHQAGNMPNKTPGKFSYSSWDVHDECNNYYGTITLESDNSKSRWINYASPDNDYGFYLEGIKFTPGSQQVESQLSVDKIYRGNDACGSAENPFPAAPKAEPAVYPGTDNPIILSTAGPNIVNDKGEVIILKGLVRPSLEWNPKGQYLSVQDINNMQTWKPNVVRINMNQNFWFASTEAEGSYKQIIDAMIHYSIQNNMAVILDLHWVEDGHQSPMPNKASVNFWEEVAAKYKDFGTVIFELYNEPMGVDENVWLNGSSTYAGYQELYNAVRNTGAKNTIIVNGLDWGYNISFVNDDFKVNGYNIVYGSHPYNEKGRDGYNGPGGSLENNFEGVLGKYPLIFTEFGVNDLSYFPNGYQEVYQENLTYLTEHNISYTAFAWWVENDPNNANKFPSVIKDWSGTPLNGGVYINDDMLAAPGTPIGTK